MRRPASRRPPKIPDPPAPKPAGPRRAPTPTQQLRAQHVFGTHAGLGREELKARLKRVVAGEAEALLGLAPFEGATLESAFAAITVHLGYEEHGANVAIDGRVTMDRMREAIARIRDVAHHRGTVAVATSRPAAMLGLLQALACLAEVDGAEVLGLARTAPFKADGRSNRRLWWYGGVAAISDGESIVPVRRPDAAQEWLFLLGRPDLVVADGAFAGVALAAGIETVAFADLDDAALALAADAGLPITLVPLDTARPPMAYAALLAPDVIEPVESDPPAEGPDPPATEGP